MQQTETLRDTIYGDVRTVVLRVLSGKPIPKNWGSLKSRGYVKEKVDRYGLDDTLSELTIAVLEYSNPKQLQGMMLAVSGINSHLNKKLPPRDPVTFNTDTVKAADQAPFRNRSTAGKDPDGTPTFEGGTVYGAYRPPEPVTARRRFDPVPLPSQAPNRLNAATQDAYEIWLTENMTEKEADAKIAWRNAQVFKHHPVVGDTDWEFVREQLGVPSERAAMMRVRRARDAFAQHHGFEDASDYERKRSKQWELEELGVTTSGKPNKQGWVNIKCPYHDDNRKSNAGYHLGTDRFKCWVDSCSTNDGPTMLPSADVIGLSPAEFERVKDEQQRLYAQWRKENRPWQTAPRAESPSVLDGVRATDSPEDLDLARRGKAPVTVLKMSEECTHPLTSGDVRNCVRCIQCE